MKSHNFYKTFDLGTPQTCAHSYLCRTIKQILQNHKIPKIANILDAGCGGGFIVNKLYSDGYENIWGFDLSRSGIEVAKENYNSLRNKFVLHDCYERTLPDVFPQEEYNLILSIEIIEHLYSPKTYLKNIHFWLNKDGHLILTTPYHGYLKNLVLSLANYFDHHFDPLCEGGHIKFFSKKTLYKLLEETGFKPIGFYGSGWIPFLWKSMVVISKKI